MNRNEEIGLKAFPRNSLWDRDLHAEGLLANELRSNTYKKSERRNRAGQRGGWATTSLQPTHSWCTGESQTQVALQSYSNWQKRATLTQALHQPVSGSSLLPRREKMSQRPPVVPGHVDFPNTVDFIKPTAGLLTRQRLAQHNIIAEETFHHLGHILLVRKKS